MEDSGLQPQGSTLAGRPHLPTACPALRSCYVTAPGPTCRALPSVEVKCRHLYFGDQHHWSSSVQQSEQEGPGVPANQAKKGMVLGWDCHPVVRVQDL